MAETHPKKMVILISHNGNDDKATVGFTIANVALSTGMQVDVFLTSDGVEPSRDGACDLTHVKPFKSLTELIEAFVAKGGVVWSRAPCFQPPVLKQEETVDKAIVIGAGPLLDWIAEGAATLSL